jgi:hypothetical protein
MQVVSNSRTVHTTLNHQLQDVTSTVVEMAHNRWQQSLLLDVSKRLT